MTVLFCFFVIGLGMVEIYFLVTYKEKIESFWILEKLSIDIEVLLGTSIALKNFLLFNYMGKFILEE